MFVILAILQARYSSSRLPGKVLKPILGTPMLALQIERILCAKKIDKLVVATSVNDADASIYNMCRSIDVDCFRGDLNNVLDRFYQAAKPNEPDYIVRLTGDCPLIDPEIVDSVIQFCLDGNYDYVSNSLKPTFPDGLDVEIFKFAALESAWQEASLPSHKEHVTPFIYLQPDRYKVSVFKNGVDLSDLRWTVDEKEDFEFVSKIYSALYNSNPRFVMKDVLQLLEIRPELAQINTKYQRNEGLQKSLQVDKHYYGGENE